MREPDACFDMSTGTAAFVKRRAILEYKRRWPKRLRTRTLHVTLRRRGATSVPSFLWRWRMLRVSLCRASLQVRARVSTVHSARRLESTMRYFPADRTAPREVPTPLVFLASPRWTGEAAAEQCVVRTARVADVQAVRATDPKARGAGLLVACRGRRRAVCGCRAQRYHKQARTG